MVHQSPLHAKATITSLFRWRVRYLGVFCERLLISILQRLECGGQFTSLDGYDLWQSAGYASGGYDAEAAFPVRHQLLEPGQSVYIGPFMLIADILLP